MKNNFLAAMVVFKNEKRYLKEWIEFHLKSGLEHFYFFDNMSEDNPEEILKPYIDEGIVTLEKLETDLIENPECSPHRTHFKVEYGENNQWVLFIDLDEYCYPLKEKNLKVFIESNNAEVSQILIPCVIYGDNKQVKYEPKPTIERFNRRCPVGCQYNVPYHFKPLVRINDVIGFINSHMCEVSGKSILESKKIVHNFTQLHKTPNKYEPINLRINHYWSRSKEEYFNFKNHYYSDKEKNNRFIKWNNGKNLLEDNSAINFFKR